MVKHCHEPIISIGIIGYQRIGNEIKYIMVKRRDTLGLINMVRGKYMLHQKESIMQMIDEMTLDEKDRVLHTSFQELMKDLLLENQISQNEMSHARKRFHSLQHGIIMDKKHYTLEDLVSESTTRWSEQEWCFPKGRRDTKENDLQTAMREFREETGIPEECIHLCTNVMTFEENFIGSNYKAYTYKYYLAEIHHEVSPDHIDVFEISDIAYLTKDECISKIRPYNTERIALIERVDNILKKYKIKFLQ